MPVTVSNPKKVFWPEAGYTKSDLVAYYRAIAPWILPYLKDRPVVLIRYPDGIEGKSFFQKDAPPGVPGWIRTEHIFSKTRGGDIRYLILESAEALAWIANLAAIELHVWACTTDDLDRPTWAIIDLDPKKAPFSDVVRIARAVLKVCKEIELTAYLKTSGSTGLHVMLPIAAQFDFEQVRALTTLIANVVHAREPKITTLNRSIAKRGSKVYIDCGQNRPGQTIAAPFSVRGRVNAPVSMPLKWSELSPSKDNQTYHIKNALRRLGHLKTDPMRSLLTDTPNLAAAEDKLDRLMGSDQ